MTYPIRTTLFLCLLPLSLLGQTPLSQPVLMGRFLADSIEIGRPFQYALTYRHDAKNDVLFPDTTQHFAPYRVQKVAVFATQTTGTGSKANSRDSAVYTLVSFETDSIQLLQVPIRVIHETDCTALWTQTDTVFLRSKLRATALVDSSPPIIKPALLTETTPVPLEQQFNYTALAAGFMIAGLAALGLYGLFGRRIAKQWQLYQLSRRHLQFLNEYNRLSRGINAYTASETANQAVIIWKSYLERLDSQPYTSLTTPELAERMNDDRIMNALREADRMIYGGSFSPDSQPALRLLSEVATNIYHRCQNQMREAARSVPSTTSHSAETPAVP